MPFNFEPTDVIIIILAALIVFGPSRLPDIGHGLGKAISEFRRGIAGKGEGASRPGTQPKRTEPRPVAPSTTGGKQCAHCGGANTLDARFCNHCGTELSDNPVLDA